MIYVDTAPIWRCCNCCGSSAYKEVTFKNDGQGTQIALCLDCLETLEMLVYPHVRKNVVLKQEGRA